MLQFATDETIPRLEAVPGLILSGTNSFHATLTTPNNDGRRVQSQTIQSLLPNDVFSSWGGMNTVEYVFPPLGVSVDLQSGLGMNAFGGADTFISVERLVGSAFDDTLQGDAGDNVFIGGLGNDTMRGGAGLDVAEYANGRGAYAVVHRSGMMSVNGVHGFDILEGIERLHFADTNIAFDLGAGQAAGMTARIVGAAFDASRMRPDLVGAGIDLFDAGYGMLQVCELALNTPLYLSLAGSHSNVDFVNTVYRNIMGVLPSGSERDSLEDLLQGSGGSMTQAQLLMLAANNPNNDINIGLVGLQQTGVDFV